MNPGKKVGAESQAVRTRGLRAELLAGKAFTRPEACERFGISGSTFRWTIKSMREAGVPLVYEEVVGARNNPTRRWRVGSQ